MEKEEERERESNALYTSPYNVHVKISVLLIQSIVYHPDPLLVVNGSFNSYP
jgi:hypothetical protein